MKLASSRPRRAEAGSVIVFTTIWVTAVLMGLAGIFLPPPHNNPMLVILAAFVYFAGQQELLALRRREAQRRMAALEPVPVVFRGAPESPDSFVLQNEGWGRMTDVRLRYAVLPGEAPLPPSTPYPYSTAPGAVVDEGTIDVRSGVARSGLPARGRATVPGVRAAASAVLRWAAPPTVLVSVGARGWPGPVRAAAGPGLSMLRRTGHVVDAVHYLTDSIYVTGSRPSSAATAGRAARQQRWVCTAVEAA